MWDIGKQNSMLSRQINQYISISYLLVIWNNQNTPIQIHYNLKYITAPIHIYIWQWEIKNKNVSGQSRHHHHAYRDIGLIIVIDKTRTYLSIWQKALAKFWFTIPAWAATITHARPPRVLLEGWVAHDTLRSVSFRDSFDTKKLKHIMKYEYIQNATGKTKSLIP